jgi:hypothetical protein
MAEPMRGNGGTYPSPFCGGGLFNAKGELVGITTFRMKGEQSLNFALPVEWIDQIEWVVQSVTPMAPKAGKAPGVPKPSAPPKEHWSDQAGALAKGRDWPGLLAHCRRWTQAEPNNDLAWSSLGLAYGQLGRHREASEACREASISHFLRPAKKLEYPTARNNPMGLSFTTFGAPSRLIC